MGHDPVQDARREDRRLIFLLSFAVPDGQRLFHIRAISAIRGSSCADPPGRKSSCFLSHYLTYQVLRFFPDYAGKKRCAGGAQLTFYFKMICYVKDMKTTNEMADDFSTYRDEELEGSYDCVDRMVVNAYYKMGQTAAGFRTWWRQRLRHNELGR